MTIDSISVLLFTVGFLVPGFVWSAVLAVMIPARRSVAEIRFLEFLTLSCINHGLWAWPLFWIYQTLLLPATLTTRTFILRRNSDLWRTGNGLLSKTPAGY